MAASLLSVKQSYGCPADDDDDDENTVSALATQEYAPLNAELSAHILALVVINTIRYTACIRNPHLKGKAPMNVDNTR
jgi:hypothetical protein